MHLTPGHQEALGCLLETCSFHPCCLEQVQPGGEWVQWMVRPSLCSWDPTINTPGAAFGFSVPWCFFLSICRAVRSLHLAQTFLSIWAVGNLDLRSLREFLPRGCLTKSHGGLRRSFRVHLRDSAQSPRLDCSSQCLSWMCFAHLILLPFFGRWL